ncbi:hypothetical protein CcarbDRAFT_3786 [Clostridium carboxidivorans P7]|uniref:Uncharacterized protein n=1 Tax=Clostridium carboxidivorans P7 TaxID=536227 RepID=C6PYB9_9CLOT|nr:MULTISPECIES: hypothetical protein [Clostridium]EET85740.1 hypothetical protein CcarbDRAFT_3786 [Clostridium carboxidivorans P7]WPC42040.1 hypothetical protein Q6H37_00735 [Clostridium sp. JS66]
MNKSKKGNVNAKEVNIGTKRTQDSKVLEKQHRKERKADNNE